MSEAALECIIAENKRMASENARLIADNSRLSTENKQLNTAKNNAVAEQERLQHRLNELQRVFDENIDKFNALKADSLATIDRMQVMLNNRPRRFLN